MSLAAGTGPAALDRRACLADPRRKQAYVDALFGVVAPRYDRFTRSFSFGMDRMWKDELVGAWARHLPSGPICDCACGTGDLAAAIDDQLPGPRRIQGFDPVPGMIAAARRRHAHRKHMDFQIGDCMHLPLADASQAGVGLGYGLRNMPDVDQALSEVHRVLRPGGVVAILDFCRPAWAPWRRLYLAWLRVAGLCIGRCWHGDGEIYGYIARSIAAFRTADGLVRACRDAGLQPLWQRRRLGGGILELLAGRPAA